MFIKHKWYIPLGKKLLGKKVFMEFIFPIFLVSREIKFRNDRKIKLYEIR